MATHELHSSPETCHWGYFDSQLKPQLRIKSGDIATIHCVSGAAEILPEPPMNVLPEHREILAKLKPHIGRHILTGPVHVEGAERGDALAVEVLDIKVRTNWGWNVQRPLMGTLPEDFPFYRLTHIPIDSNRGVCTMPWGLEVKLNPFFGIMGVAPPPEWGQCSSVEPRAFGGNIDNKHFNVGTTVYLPVFAPGGLFSTGDGHGVQGDGEVCLTALETALQGTFTLILHKATGLRFPRAITPTHYIAMGMDQDLDDAAKQALREMIAWLVELKGWKPLDAYVSCSLACDLHVTQIVDGNKGVHAMFPRALLDKAKA